HEWAIATGKESPSGPPPDEAWRPIVSPDGKHLIHGRWQVGGLYLSDFATGKPLAPVSPKGLRVAFADFVATPDGKGLIVRASDAPVIAVYEFPSLKPRVTITLEPGATGPGVPPSQPTISVGTLMVSPHGQRVAGYSSPRTLSVWDTTTGKKVAGVDLPESKVAH